MVLHVHLCDFLYFTHVFFVFSAANSAVILFYFQFANIVFLGLFSFFLLTDLHPLGENGAPSIVEIFTWIYTITSVIEEMRQVRYFFFECHCTDMQSRGVGEVIFEIMDDCKRNGLHLRFIQMVLLSFQVPRYSNYYWKGLTSIKSCQASIIMFLKVFNSY